MFTCKASLHASKDSNRCSGNTTRCFYKSIAIAYDYKTALSSPHRPKNMQQYTPLEVTKMVHIKACEILLAMPQGRTPTTGPQLKVVVAKEAPPAENEARQSTAQGRMHTAYL